MTPCPLDTDVSARSNRVGVACPGGVWRRPRLKTAITRQCAALTRRLLQWMCGLVLLMCTPTNSYGQPLGEPDRDQPGDPAIQRWLAREAVRLDRQFEQDTSSRAAWEANLPRYRAEYLAMLGLSPLPDRTPLHPTVTGTYRGEGFVVENLHYQSQPGLYVTANLYRPAKAEAGQRFPAVLYVCGHSHGGRDGGKTRFQAHGIWLARHGFVCMIVDTLQLGEIAAKHHGTYNLQRWWWHSRGYTPAGVECWNGIRGLDYLTSRADVDGERLGVTGISGGGAATFWIAAADERVRVAIPISGQADLESYVAQRVINGHCDCMFLYNNYQWPWTRIAGLIAPRPMLFINSDHDAIFPMDANARISQRMERLYSLYGAGDRFDTVVSVGGHAYREDIRRATFAFLRYHLQADAAPVTDSEVDLCDESAPPTSYPIPPERLRVFATDADIPVDERNTRIDQEFVPRAQLPLPRPDEFAEWKGARMAALQQSVFRPVPLAATAAGSTAGVADGDWQEVTLGEFLRLRMQPRREPASRTTGVVLNPDEKGARPSWPAASDDRILYLEPAGVGRTEWTRRNPPNYVERALALVGQTADSLRVHELVAALREDAELRRQGRRPPTRTVLAGRGAAGVLAAYAALLSGDAIQEVELIDPPATHNRADAPQFLGVLRVTDIPDVLGLLAPRPLKITTASPEAFARTKALYEAAGAPGALVIQTP